MDQAQEEPLKDGAPIGKAPTNAVKLVKVR